MPKKETNKFLKTRDKKYDPKTTPFVIEALLRRGFDLKQIADYLGVIPQTVRIWKQRYKEVRDVFDRAPELAVLKIEEALIKRALGYEYEEVITEVIKNEPAKGQERVKVRKITKHVPPDVTAIKILLMKYDPKFWGDLKDIQTQVNTQVNVMNDLPKVVIGAPPEQVKNKATIVNGKALPTSDSEK